MKSQIRTRSEYCDYLSSEQWLQRRKIFLFDHPTCNRCGILNVAALLFYDQRLHVHHKNYQRIGRELDSDLEVLCRRCHEIETFERTDLPPMYLDWQELATLRGLIGPEIPQTWMTEDGLAGVFA